MSGTGQSRQPIKLQAVSSLHVLRRSKYAHAILIKPVLIRWLPSEGECRIQLHHGFSGGTNREVLVPDQRVNQKVRPGEFRMSDTGGNRPLKMNVLRPDSQECRTGWRIHVEVRS